MDLDYIRMQFSSTYISQAPHRNVVQQHSQPDRVREIPVIHESAGRTQSAPVHHGFNAQQPSITQIPIQREGRGDTPPQKQYSGIPQHVRSEGWHQSSPPPRGGSPVRSIPIRVEQPSKPSQQMTGNGDHMRRYPVQEENSHQQQRQMPSQQGTYMNNQQGADIPESSPMQSSPGMTRANTHTGSPSRQGPPPNLAAEQPRASPVPSHLRTESPTPQRAASPALARMTPIEQINTIQQESDQLQSKLKGFKGAKGSKEYRYLEEMLTRLLLKLDGIESEGKDEIRQARKQAIRSVQAGLDHLELVGMANEVSDEATSQQHSTPVETENTPAAPSSENHGEDNSNRPSQHVKDVVMESGVQC